MMLLRSPLAPCSYPAALGFGNSQNNVGFMPWYQSLILLEPTATLLMQRIPKVWA